MPLNCSTLSSNTSQSLINIRSNVFGAGCLQGLGMLHSSSRLLRQGPALLPAVSRQARLLTVAKAKQQKGKKEGGGEPQERA